MRMWSKHSRIAACRTRWGRDEKIVDCQKTATGQYSSVGIGCVSLVDKNDEVARDTVVALGKDVVRIPSEETEKPDEYPSSTQEQVISHEPQEGKTKKVVVSAVDIRSGDR